MADLESLLAKYLPLINAEFQRIGFTEDDFRHLGSGGVITEAGLQAQLVELRGVPSDIGAQAYFAEFGIDFDAVKHDASRRDEAGPDIDDSVV